MIKIINGTREMVDFQKLEDIKLHYNKADESYPNHWHVELEIIMPIKNPYTVKISGEIIEIKEGDIFVIPPGELHELVAPPIGERIILQIKYDLLAGLREIDGLLEVLQPYQWIRCDQNPQVAEVLRKYIFEIKEEYTSEQSFKELNMLALIIRMCVVIGRESKQLRPMHTPGVNKQQEYIEKFVEVCNYVSVNYQEQISIDEVAAIAGFSKFHFCRLFKQTMGCSFYEYLSRQRVLKAEKLLDNSRLSITEVAMQSGFNSISTFNRTFKEYKSCTPSQYRQLKWTSQPEENNE